MATHKEKEQEKLKLLYDIYEQPMYRIAYAILHHTEQAEDAVSDAFLRILKNLKKIGDVRSEKNQALHHFDHSQHSDQPIPAEPTGFRTLYRLGRPHFAGPQPER